MQTTIVIKFRGNFRDCLSEIEDIGFDNLTSIEINSLKEHPDQELFKNICKELNVDLDDLLMQVETKKIIHNIFGSKIRLKAFK